MTTLDTILTPSEDRPLVIVCDAQGWAVKAEWLGAVRTVHRGDIFSCIAYRSEVSDDE